MNALTQFFAHFDTLQLGLGAIAAVLMHLAFESIVRHNSIIHQKPIVEWIFERLPGFRRAEPFFSCVTVISGGLIAVVLVVNTVILMREWNMRGAPHDFLSVWIWNLGVASFWSLIALWVMTGLLKLTAVPVLESMSAWFKGWIERNARTDKAIRKKLRQYADQVRAALPALGTEDERRLLDDIEQVSLELVLERIGRLQRDIKGTEDDARRRRVSINNLDHGTRIKYERFQADLKETQQYLDRLLETVDLIEVDARAMHYATGDQDKVRDTLLEIVEGAAKATVRESRVGADVGRLAEAGAQRLQERREEGAERLRRLREEAYDRLRRNIAEGTSRKR